MSEPQSELAQWVEKFINPDTATITAGTVELDLTGRGNVAFPSVPEGTELDLKGLGTVDSDVVIRFQGRGPAVLRIGKSPALRKLTIQDGAGRLQYATLSFPDGSVALAIMPCERLELNGGINLRSRLIADTLALSDCSIALRQETKISRLELQGLVTVSGMPLYAKATALQGNTVLVADVDVSCGDLAAGEAARTWTIAGGSGTHITTANVQSDIRLESGTLFIENELAGEEAVEALNITGDGEVVVTGIISRFSMWPSTRIVLSLRAGAKALDCVGQVFLNAEPGSVLIGHPTHPLQITRILSAANSELHGVDLYGLGISDLQPLSEAERISPRFPRSRREARRLEDSMMLGAVEQWISRSRRAHFWTRLSRILAQSHAPGAVQSQARYAAMRARRIALPWGRERILLSLHAVIGYGERIGRPLLLHAAASLSAVGLLLPPRDAYLSTSFEQLGATVRAWTRLLMAPLAFFRFIEAPSASGLWSGIGVASVGAFGILMLFFAFTAIRRVVKAE